MLSRKPNKIFTYVFASVSLWAMSACDISFDDPTDEEEDTVGDGDGTKDDSETGPDDTSDSDGSDGNDSGDDDSEEGDDKEDSDGSDPEKPGEPELSCE